MPLVVREEAEADIRDALRWYSAQRPGLELEFLDAVDEAFTFLLRWPGKAQRLAPGIRRLPLERFPYSVIHASNKEDVVVLRVFHHKRDPRTTLRRKRGTPRRR
jgi:plasmid stabilization system protein ParE